MNRLALILPKRSRIGALNFITLVFIGTGLLFAFTEEDETIALREEVASIEFRDVVPEAGIDFKHNNAGTAEKYLIETIGAGCAWLDYDGDGMLDIYFANSTGTQAYKPPQSLRGGLYRNNGDGTFADTTEQAGVGAEGLFGMGVAPGDYDNDGDPDLLVVGYGRSILYRNKGDGTFEDVTETAGVSNTGRWGSSGAWFDYDNDGWLDLVIANYVDWSPDNNIFCGEQRPGYRAYCHPNRFQGQKPTLYRNQGDGTFEDASSRSGIAERPGNGLGVVCFDYNNDGWVDIFIANDSMENFLFLNQRDGTFRDVSFESGVAFGEHGQAEAGMGTDAGDFNGDGLMDLYVTHLDFELDRLYRNVGGGIFEDATYQGKLGYATFLFSGFGTRFIDFDNNGTKDIFVANGHILDNIKLFHQDTSYAEPKFMFQNLGNGTFENVTDQLGPDMNTPRVSRGAAVGDYDNDGDLDILISNNGETAQLLRNDGGNRNNWLGVQLIGTKSNRDAIGARLKLVSEDLVQYEQSKGGMSYQSGQDLRIYFGLGGRSTIDLLEIRWPSGFVEELKDLTPNRIVTVKEQTGVVAYSFPTFAGMSE